MSEPDDQTAFAGVCSRSDQAGCEDPPLVVDIPVSDLVLTFVARVDIPKPVRDLVRAWADANEWDPEEFGLADFLTEVWPDGAPATMYVSNIGYDPGVPAHRLDLLLRPLCEGPKARRPAVGGLTLAFRAYRAQDRLNIKGIEVTPHVLRRDFEVRVSGPVRWGGDFFMTDADFASLAGLPFHRAVTAERLQSWRLYLDWKEALVHRNQLKVPYDGWRWEGETLLGFLVRARDLPPPRLVGLALGATVQPADNGDEEDAGEHRYGNGRHPQRGRRREPEVTVLGEVEAVEEIDLQRDRDGWGDVRVDRGHRRVVIRVEEEQAELLRHKVRKDEKGLPAVGLLVSSIAGDLAPLFNQRGGVNRLNNSQGFSPRLADFIFSAKSASVPLDVPEDLPPVCGGRDLNPGQREAVRKALAAPDLCLIQGPPGTGKTTVIADICLRAAVEGKRVLVASQTNLAVDNALARLSDAPAVRALRLGDPDRVDDEFKEFLIGNVIDRWFANIAGYCRGRMDAAQESEAALLRRERAIDALATALATYERAAKASDDARSTSERARRAEEDARARLDAARRAADDAAKSDERLRSLIRWCASDAPLPADAGVEWSDKLVSLPRGLDRSLPPLAALDRARQREVPLRAVMVAIEVLMAGSDPDPEAGQELRSLRAEKAGLIDSDSAPELRRLQVVNRRIKQIEGAGWNRLTGNLHRAARTAWPHAPPPCIAGIVDTLEPSNATRDALREAGDLVERELATAKRAREAIGALALVWRDRASVVAAEHERAMRALGSREQERREAEAAVEGALWTERVVGEELRAARQAWDRAWGDAGVVQEVGDPTDAALREAGLVVAAARKEAGHRVERARRWRRVQTEWLARLDRASDTDREQLQILYVRWANVVGMTCNEAGKRKVWQDPEFRPFDIVIVDEVSKATPPELILPLLLGHKAVLVGDHRQLPPMFRERDASFGEATEDGEIRREDYDRFKRMVTASLFQELFEDAHDAIKAMLWTQYRMHPAIMDAVNQFYEGRLEAGPSRKALGKSRDHHLDIDDGHGGRLLELRQHLLWVDSSKDPGGTAAWDEQAGSSKVNRLEVDLVVALLLRIGQQLVKLGYGATRETEIDKSDEGKALREIVARLLGGAAPETIADLFEERRVRVDGRSQKPGDSARPGSRLRVMAQREVGVITFYGAQLKLLRGAIDACKAKHPEPFGTMELRTNTVDRFQGMEKPIIIASLVRSKEGRLGSFVREFQRINVGLSRAQRLLVVVGAEETWKNAQVPLPPLDGGSPVDVPAYLNIIEQIRRSGGRRLARQILG